MNAGLFDAEAEHYDAAYDGRARGGRVLRARLAAVVDPLVDRAPADCDLTERDIEKLEPTMLAYHPPKP